MKVKNHFGLTDEQKAYVRLHSKEFSISNIKRRLCVTEYWVSKLIKDEHLETKVKCMPKGLKEKRKVPEGYFDCNERQIWV